MFHLLEPLAAGDLVQLFYLLPVDVDIAELGVWEWADPTAVLAVYVDEDIPSPTGEFSCFLVG